MNALPQNGEARVHIVHAGIHPNYAALSSYSSLMSRTSPGNTVSGR